MNSFTPNSCSRDAIRLLKVDCVVKMPELDVFLHQFIRIVRGLADVIVTPSTEFGAQFLHEFRINFSQDKDKAVVGMKRLFEVMNRYRKK